MTSNPNTMMRHRDNYRGYTRTELNDKVTAKNNPSNTTAETQQWQAGNITEQLGNQQTHRNDFKSKHNDETQGQLQWLHTNRIERQGHGKEQSEQYDRGNSAMASGEHHRTTRKPTNSSK